VRDKPLLMIIIKHRHIKPFVSDFRFLYEDRIQNMNLDGYAQKPVTHFYTPVGDNIHSL
jgi:hypothetical protein